MRGHGSQGTLLQLKLEVQLQGILPPGIQAASVIALWLISYSFKAYSLPESRVLADGPGLLRAHALLSRFSWQFLALPGAEAAKKLTGKEKIRHFLNILFRPL